MHLPRLFKTVSFKLAAFYAAAFGISVLILGAVVYITASNAFDDQTKARILAESSALNDLYKSNGLAAVRKTIETRQGHRLFLGRKLNSTETVSSTGTPFMLKMAQRFPFLQAVPAYVIAIGPRPEHAPEFARRKPQTIARS